MAVGCIIGAVTNQSDRAEIRSRSQADVLCLLQTGYYADEEDRNVPTVVSKLLMFTGLAIWASHPLLKAFALSAGVTKAVTAMIGMFFVWSSFFSIRVASSPGDVRQINIHHDQIGLLITSTVDPIPTL